ncbi:MAG TPA: dTMP kinase [Burkholderiales bacterium]|nr:dTMP kinase [Burkholderiales bacterium]
MTGRFITLEGMDGAGKSTHIPWIAEVLEQSGRTVRVTREPGGTALGERLRELLLDPSQQVVPQTEALLMFAARRQHLETIILPALASGEFVVCDRFTDATFAYQGWGRGVSLDKLKVLEQWVQETFQPAITFYFDLPPEVARARMAGIRSPDRFEQEQEAFFDRVRRGYLSRAREFPERIRVIDATSSVDEVRAALRPHLMAL